MKGVKLSTISKAVGAAAGVISIASVSAWISTRYLLRMALDREEPVLLKSQKKESAEPNGITGLFGPFRNQQNISKKSQTKLFLL